MTRENIITIWEAIHNLSRNIGNRGLRVLRLDFYSEVSASDSKPRGDLTRSMYIECEPADLNVHYDVLRKDIDYSDPIKNFKNFLGDLEFDINIEHKCKSCKKEIERITGSKGNTTIELVNFKHSLKRFND